MTEADAIFRAMDDSLNRMLAICFPDGVPVGASVGPMTILPHEESGKVRCMYSFRPCSDAPWEAHDVIRNWPAAF